MAFVHLLARDCIVKSPRGAATLRFLVRLFKGSPKTPRDVFSLKIRVQPFSPTRPSFRWKTESFSQAVAPRKNLWRERTFQGRKKTNKLQASLLFVVSFQKNEADTLTRAKSEVSTR